MLPIFHLEKTGDRSRLCLGEAVVEHSQGSNSEEKEILRPGQAVHVPDLWLLCRPCAKGSGIVALGLSQYPGHPHCDLVSQEKKLQALP